MADAKSRIECDRILSLHDRATPYEVLGIPSDSTKADVKKAYFSLALTCHPDKNHEENEKYTTIFKRMLDAYNKLQLSTSGATTVSEPDISQPPISNPDESTQVFGLTLDAEARRKEQLKKWLRSLINGEGSKLLLGLDLDVKTVLKFFKANVLATFGAYDKKDTAIYRSLVELQELAIATFLSQDDFETNLDKQGWTLQMIKEYIAFNKSKPNPSDKITSILFENIINDPELTTRFNLAFASGKYNDILDYKYKIADKLNELRKLIDRYGFKVDSELEEKINAIFTYFQSIEKNLSKTYKTSIQTNRQYFEHRKAELLKSSEKGGSRRKHSKRRLRKTQQRRKRNNRKSKKYKQV